MKPPTANTVSIASSQWLFSHETFEKEGDLPVFVVRVKDDAGNVTERKYKLNTPIVRRVLAAGNRKSLQVVKSSVVSQSKKEEETLRSEN